MHTMKKLGAVVLTGLLLGASPALASSISYPAVTVQDGVFDNIVETSITDPLPLYGTPTAGPGNSMIFNMSSYSAKAIGDMTDITAGALEFTLQADDGKTISSISLFEMGTLSIIEEGGLTAAGALTVRYYDEQTQQFVTLSDPIHMLITWNGVPGGTFPIDTVGTGSWTGSALIDLEALGIQTSYIIVALDNNLIASSCGCGEAEITKDQMVINATIIPEPASLALMGLGSVMILRKRA